MSADCVMVLLQTALTEKLDFAEEYTKRRDSSLKAAQAYDGLRAEVLNEIRAIENGIAKLKL